MKTYTVWVQAADRQGTCHISAHDAVDMEQAKRIAMADTIADWGDGFATDDLFVLGVAMGDVAILEWNDE